MGAGAGGGGKAGALSRRGRLGPGRDRGGRVDGWLRFGFRWAGGHGRFRGGRDVYAAGVWGVESRIVLIFCVPSSST